MTAELIGSSEELDRLMANRRKVSPGEIIFLEGHVGDTAFIILSGEVQVAVGTKQEDLVTINNMAAGELFGEIALLCDDYQRTATAVSKDGCELLVIEKATFEKHIASADPFLRLVMDHLCKRILMWTDRVRKA